MYVYLYDNFLRQKKYSAAAQALEVNLTDYGIAGKILRLHSYIDTKELIEDEIKKGAKTIVIVGNDKTLGQALSRAATFNCIYGFLPVGGDNLIAQVLGIPVGVEAVNVLARRLTKKLDVGWVNNRYFVSQLHIHPAKQLEVVYDEKFRATANDLMEVVVCNLMPFYWRKEKSKGQNEVVRPEDGKLEAFLRPLTKKRFWGYSYEEPSIFPFEEMAVRSQEPFTVEADGKITKERTVLIRLAKNKINMIVGKDRLF